MVQGAQVTDHRKSVAEGIAERWGLRHDEVLESPYFLIGTPDQIVADIRRHRSVYGISRWTVFQPAMQAFAPIAETLCADRHL